MSKEMKLELKHITPYLPYGLQILRPYGNTILNVVGLSVNSIVTTIEDSEEKFCSIGGVKPILRPMSDLYVPLKHGHIPIVEVFEMTKTLNEGYNVCSDELIYDDGYENCSFFWNSSCQCFMNGDGDDFISFEIIDYLFQHKFDVFGLIDKGLAVDVNEIPF